MERFRKFVVELRVNDYPFQTLFVGADRLPPAEDKRRAITKILQEIACDPDVAIISNTENPELYEEHLARVVHDCMKQGEIHFEKKAQQQEQLASHAAKQREQEGSCLIS